MRDNSGRDLDQNTSSQLSRRSFIGGVTALAAAGAYSLSVPEEVAGRVTDGDDSPTRTISSPDGRVSVTIDVSGGTATYSVAYDDTPVIEPSALGFEFQHQDPFRHGLTVTGSERTTVDRTWTPVWDQYDEIRERYTALRLGLEERASPRRSGTLELRVFDDGVGLRFVFSERFGDSFTITSERTEYNFAGDFTAWWIPNDFNSFEYPYEQTALSDVAETLESGWDGSFDGVHTPITMRTDDDRYLSVHEANLEDYASLAIAPTGETSFESTLAPLPDGTKVAASGPHLTPWRTIQVGDRPGALVESNLIVNLNDDPDLTEFPHGLDWIEPQKFVGVWWLMITGRADWEYMGPHTGNHGAQTARVKQYMEFADEHDIPGVLVEGWNQGWSSYPTGGGDAFDFTESYPDFDLEAVTDYGSQLDTQMTMHNETAGGFENYESQLDAAFSLYDDLGIHTIKNGYVRDDGDLAQKGHNHHNQVLVNHHHLVARTAAANRQLLDIHEPVHPTGRRRTYPNLMTREGVFGQEYDSFGEIPPSHHVTFPFTRMLAGPVEFTPGIFDMDSGSGGIETTRAKQLAMYPTYFSGLQMVADLPSSYLAEQPADLSVDDVAQAEFGDRSGIGTAARWANAQGTQYVEFDPNSAEPGASVTWSVDAVAPGDYDLHLRYASDAENNAVPVGEPRTATVMVDGTPTTQLTFSPTDYWDEWETTATTVTVTAETDSIGVALTERDTGGFNLDAIALTQPGEPMPAPETAPIRGPTVEAFQFIEDVPAAGWDDTRVLDAAIGEYMVTARRKGDEWFVGAMTDENGRALDVSLAFLSPRSDRAQGKGRPQGPKYVAEIYSDGIEASYDDRLEPVRVDEAIVTPSTTLLASMVESGGTALRLRPATAAEIDELPAYRRPEQELTISIDSETFVEEPFVTATGTNTGDYIGGTTVELLVDGEQVGRSNVRFSPDATNETDELSYTLSEPGTYTVTVRTTDAEISTTETVSVAPPETVTHIDDPADDDHGPGGYTYPTADAYRDGAFDLLSFEAAQTPSIGQFTLAVETLYDVWGGRFSPHQFVVWLRDPDASGGSTESLDDLGANVSFERPWHYRLQCNGFTMGVVDAGGSAVTDDDGTAIDPQVAVDFDAGTVTLTIDRTAFDGASLADMEVAVAIGSEEYGSFRPVYADTSQHAFGGARADAIDNAPRIIDLLTPEDVDQAAALDYDVEGRATVPFVSLH